LSTKARHKAVLWTKHFSCSFFKFSCRIARRGQSWLKIFAPTF
jgi:hypothetical protein